MWTALLLTLGVAAARPPVPEWTPDTTPMMRKLQEACFPSGLRVTIREDHREPVVAITTTVDGGRADDPPGKAGTARLLQRVSYEAHLPDGTRIRDRLLAAGATWNAKVVDQASIYMTEAPLSALPLLLEVETQRLTDPLHGITDDDIARARSTYRAELLRPQPVDPSTLPPHMPDGFYPSYVDVPGEPVTAETLAAIDRLALDHAAKVYTPQTATLYLASDLTPQQAVDLLVKELPEEVVFVDAAGEKPEQGTCVATERTPWRPEGPAPVEGGITATNGPADAVWLVYGWPLPAAYQRDEPRMRLARMFLRRRLQRGVIDFSTEREVRFDPTCDFVPGLVASAMFCRVKVPEGTNVDKLDKKVTYYLENSVEGVDQIEDLLLQLEHAAELVELNNAIGELGMVRNEAAIYDALRSHFTGASMWQADAKLAFARTGTEEIRAFVEQWLTEGMAHRRVLAPWGTPLAPILEAKGRPDFSGDEAEPIVVHHHVTADPEPLPHEAFGDARTLVTDEEIPTPRLDSLQAVTLDNGVEIVALNHGDLPVVRVGVAARTGAYHEPVRGLDDWAWDQIKWDRDRLPQQGYNTSAATVMSRVWWQGDRIGHAIGLDGTTGNLQQMLWLARRAAETFITRPSFNYRRERRFAGEDAVKRLNQDPYEQAREFRIAHAMGADHPLVLNDWERMYQGSLTDEQDLQAYTRLLWRPENSRVIVVGGLSPTLGVEAATVMFADWTEKQRDELQPPAPVSKERPTARASKTVVDPRAADADVHVACQPDQDVPPAVREVGTQVLRQVIARALTTDELGLEPPAVHMPRWDDDHAVDVRVRTAPARAQAAADAILAQIQAVAAGEADPADVTVAGRYLAQQYVVRFLDTQFVFDELVAHGAALKEHAATWGPRLVAVTPEQVQTWAKACAGTEAVTIVGPQSVAGK